jgi:hypothetical protein
MKSIYTKFYIRFQRPTQFLASQNSKGKYESWKILYFVKIIRKIDFLKILNLFCFLFQFLII